MIDTSTRKYNNTTTVLVTGASGFIGKVLCRELTMKGKKVLAFTRNRGGVQNVDSNSYVINIINGNTQWKEFLQEVDAVIHLAAHVHENNTLEDKDDLYFETNKRGTLNLAIQAANEGVRRFVFISTVKVAGEGRLNAYTEFDQPFPVGPYARSKYAAEEGLKQIASKTGMEVCIIRPPLVYGPGVRANFLKLIELVERGFPLPFKNTSNLRSLISVKNLSHAIIHCISHPQAANSVFLVSDGKPISTCDLIELIATALGKRARLFPCPSGVLKIGSILMGKGDILNRLMGSLWIDDRLIREKTGWVPSETICTGLMETIEWYSSMKRGLK